MTTEEKKDDCACGGLDAVYASIDALVDFARKRLELDPRDADWTRNRIFELFSLDSYRPTGATSDDTLPDDLLTRFRAAAVADDHPLMRAARAAGRRTFVSPTTSDRTLMPFPALKMGPGESERSHTADEYVCLSEIAEGIAVYETYIEKLASEL